MSAAPTSISMRRIQPSQLSTPADVVALLWQESSAECYELTLPDGARGERVWLGSSGRCCVWLCGPESVRWVDAGSAAEGLRAALEVEP